MINRILKEAYLLAMRDKFTLDDGTILEVFADWANVGTDVNTYALIQSPNGQGTVNNCGSESGSIQVLFCGLFDGNIDTDQLYKIQEWFESLDITHSKASITVLRATNTENTQILGSQKFTQIINTINHQVNF